MGNGREADRAADVGFVGETPNRIVGVWRIEAAVHNLRSTVDLAGMAEGVVLSSLEDLRTTRRLANLADAYRRIFGAAEMSPGGQVVWGEGARCGTCHVTIPLPTFQEIARADDPVCPACGEGLLVEMFPRDDMLDSLEKILTRAPGWEPILVILEDGEGDIHGFMYGAVAAPQVAVRRMREEQSVYADAPDGTRLESIYAGLPADPVFYFEAGAIEPGSRDGLRTVHALTALTYTRAVELGARGLIGWTTPRTNAYGLMLVQGSEIAARHGDYVYLHMRDLVSVTTVLQNTTVEETAQIVQRCFAILEADGILGATDTESR
ncbi:MAG: hypothetical protein IT198_11695 [Acidimicrobiia bacterium]|nr:hypothetical protein [Acidimicrobiia bacterium]